MIPAISINAALEKIAEAVPQGFTSPEKTQIQIKYKSFNITYGASGKVIDSIEEPLKDEAGEAGSIWVGIVEQQNNNTSSLLQEEKELLKGLAVVSSAVIARIEMENSLAEAFSELKQKNSALREILFQVESEKRRHYDVLCHFVENRIFPLLDEKVTDSRQMHIMKEMEEELLFSQPNKDLIDQLSLLSPREYQICSYIKAGMTNKEIGELLKLSSSTVEKHRHSIRKKLNLTNRNINLSIYLRNLK